MESQEFIQHIKDNFPSRYWQGLDDQEIYKLGQSLMPEQKVQSMPLSSGTTKVYLPTNYTVPRDYMSKPQLIDTSPQKFEAIGTMEIAKKLHSQWGGEEAGTVGSAAIGTGATITAAAMGDWGLVDENSSNWMKMAYNESLTGLAYQATMGEQQFKYDVADYEPTILEEIGAGLLGFFFPLDLASMALGGGIANLGIKGATKIASSKLTAKLRNKYIRKSFNLKSTFLGKSTPPGVLGEVGELAVGTYRGLGFNAPFGTKIRKEITKHALAQGTKQALTFGVYEGAKANMQGQIEGLEGWDLFKKTFSSFNHGVMLGGLSGFAGGFLGNKWLQVGKVLKDKKLAGKPISKNLQKLFDRSENRFLGISTPTWQAKGAEVGIFTTPAIKDEWQAMQKGQGFSLANIFKATVVNAGMVGTMHGVTSRLSKAKKTLEDWGREYKTDIFEGLDADAALSSLEKQLKKDREIASGSHKEFINKQLERIAEQKQKKTTEIEQTEGVVSELIIEVKNGLAELGKLTKNPPKSPGGVNKAVQQIAFGINTINTVVGLTGNKELAQVMLQFNSRLTKNLKSNVGITVNTKQQLVSLYQKLRGATGNKDLNFIEVERNGKTVRKHIKKDSKELTKEDFQKAIEVQAEGLNKTPAEVARTELDANNKVEDNSSTSEFKKGYSVDETGGRTSKSHKKPINKRHSKNKKRFVKGKGRDKEVQDRADKLSDTHNKISKDSGGNDMSYDMKNIYHQSKSIILDAIENIFLDKVVKIKGKQDYKSLNSVKNSVETMNSFSKWLAKRKKKNLYEATNRDIKQFLNEKGTGKDGLILKEFFTDANNKINNYRGKKINYSVDKFFAYGEQSAITNKITTAHEISGRKHEQRLKREFEFTDESVRDLRENVTGVRKFKDMNMKQQMKFERYVKKLISKEYSGRNSSIKGAEMRLRLKMERYGWSDKVLQKTLKSFGVRGGNIKFVKNAETLTKVESFLSEGLHRESPLTVFQQERLFDKENQPVDYDLAKLPDSVFKKFFIKAVAPTWYVMREYIDARLSSNFLGSEKIMSTIYGESSVVKNAINNILKSDKKRNMLRFIDKDRRKEATTAVEKAFILKLENKGTIKVDGKIIKLRKGDRIPWDAVVEGGSKEWKAAMFDKMGKDRIWEQFTAAIKRVATPEQFKKIEKGLEAKYQDFYHSRIINPEVVAHLHKGGLTGDWYKELVIKETRKDAVIEAKKKNLKPGTKPYNKFIEKFIEKNKEKKELALESHLWDKPMSLHSSFLMERGVIIGDKKGMIEIDTKFGKKKVKAYLEDYNQVTDTYVNNMSRMISAARYFPEWVTFTGKDGKIINIKGDISRGKMELYQRKEGLDPSGAWDYAAKAIENHLGISRDHYANSTKLRNRILKGVGNTVVTLGLSMPAWHGIKNFAIGQARNIGAFGASNTMRGLIATMDRQNWRKAREAGWLEQGKRSFDIDASPLKKAVTTDPHLKSINMENMFKYWNWMTPMEQVNRVSSAFAGLNFFEQSLRTYKGQRTVGEKFTVNDKRFFEDMLQDRLHFTKKEVDYIKSTSIEELMLKENKAFDYLTEKAAHYMHMSTQGGTGVPQLPLWASNPALKPFTIFYRIAGHATFDTYINFIKPAVKHQNPFPLLRLAIGHAVTGTALYSLYEAAFDRPNPFDSIDERYISDDDKNELLLRKVLFNVHQSGFFGIAEPFFHPTRGILSGSPLSQQFSPSSGLTNMPVTVPAMYSMGVNLAQDTYSLFFSKPGDRHWGDWTVDSVTKFLKENSALGAAIHKKNIQANYPYLHQRSKARTQWNTYLTNIGKAQPPRDWQVNPMFESLKLKLTAADVTEEDMTKAIFVVYNTLVHENLMSNSVMHPLEAHQKAISSIKQSLFRSLKVLHKPPGVTDADIENFYNTRKNEWQVFIYESDLTYESIKSTINKTFSDHSNIRHYSILGHVDNMMKEDYTPQRYSSNFYDSLDADEKKAYDSYRLFR